MRDEEEYSPQPGDMILFGRPPLDDGRKKRLFRVVGHDAETGTTFEGLPRALSAGELAELGARPTQVKPLGKLKPDWAAAGRRLAREGAGGRPKIHHVFAPSVGGWVMAPADEQAALALAQRAADQTGEPVLLARAGSGELIIGTHAALEAVGGGLGTQVILVVQPGLSDSMTMGQLRDLLSSDRVRAAVAVALASAGNSTSPAGDTTAEAALRAIAELLPPEQETGMRIPGWQYREELQTNEGGSSSTLPG